MGKSGTGKLYCRVVISATQKGVEFVVVFRRIIDIFATTGMREMRRRLGAFAAQCAASVEIERN